MLSIKYFPYLDSWLSIEFCSIISPPETHSTIRSKITSCVFQRRNNPLAILSYFSSSPVTSFRKMFSNMSATSLMKTSTRLYPRCIHKYPISLVKLTIRSPSHNPWNPKFLSYLNELQIGGKKIIFLIFMYTIWLPTKCCFKRVWSNKANWLINFLSCLLFFIHLMSLIFVW